MYIRISYDHIVARLYICSLYITYVSDTSHYRETSPAFESESVELLSFEILRPRSRETMPAPVRGATQNIQWCYHRPSAPFRLATIAGPNDRVGLIEQPVMEMLTMCAKKTAPPIARGALWRAVDLLLTAVSKTT